MIDWPIAGANAFLTASLIGLLIAPIGVVAMRPPGSRRLVTGTVFLLVASAGLLAYSWHRIPGGLGAALAGHAALAVSIAAFSQFGRVARMVFDDELVAGLAGLLLSAALTVGPLALGPVLGNLSLGLSGWVLLANPLVTVSSAAGIDLLHLDLVYRISPLAHRGVTLPAWIAACGAYAIFGLACYGVSRLRRQERLTP